MFVCMFSFSKKVCFNLLRFLVCDTNIYISIASHQTLSFSFYFYLGLLFLLFALFLRYVLLRITHSTDFSERILVIFRLIKPSAMKMRLPTSVTAIYIYMCVDESKKENDQEKPAALIKRARINNEGGCHKVLPFVMLV